MEKNHYITDKYRLDYQQIEWTAS